MTTSSEHWKRVHAVGQAALELPPDDRSQFINHECAADSRLRADVQRMVQEFEQTSGFSDDENAHHPFRQLIEQVVRSQTQPLTGQTIHGYQVGEVIASGGMGVVYHAVDLSINKNVALKVIKPGMDSEAVMARFRHEWQALSLLDHDGIARITKAGMTAENRPFFVMEFVAGQPITDFCDQHRLSIESRLRLVVRVCDAIQHAHARSVLHRDLKPSNILAERRETDDSIKIIDFGLAKALADSWGGGLRSIEGQPAGTPAYMSPERLEGKSSNDTTIDVYSLGVILFELLVGEHPFRNSSDEQTSWSAWLSVIARGAPKPSTRFRQLGRERTALAHEIERWRMVTTAQLNTGLWKDLDAIVGCAMSKDRTARYESARALADDIERHLSHEPIHARSPSWLERRRLWVLRNRAASFFIAMVSVGLAITSMLTLALFSKAAALRTQTLATARERDTAQWQSYLSSIAAAHAAIRIGDAETARQQLDHTLPANRGLEWQLLHAEAESSLHVLKCDYRVDAIAFSPDGKQIAAGTRNGYIRIWNPHSGKMLFNTPTNAGGAHRTQYHRDGEWLAASCNNGVVIVSARTGELLRKLGPKGYGDMWALSISPDGKRLAAGSGLPSRGASEGGLLCLWDTDTWKQVCEPHELEGGVWTVGFSRDSAALVSAIWDRKDTGVNESQLDLWDSRSGAHRAALEGHLADVDTLDFSADGRWLATGSDDCTIRIWDSSNGTGLRVLPDRRVEKVGNKFFDVAFSDDCKQLAGACYDHTVRVWNTETWLMQSLSYHRDRVECLAYTPDGSRLVTGAVDGSLRVWDARVLATSNENQPSRSQSNEPEATGISLADLRGHSSKINAIACSFDNALLASASDDATVRIWDANIRNGPVRRNAGGAATTFLTCSDDLKFLASAHNDSFARVWDSATGACLLTLPCNHPAVNGVALAAHDEVVVTTDDSGSLLVWNWRSTLPLRSLTYRVGGFAPVVNEDGSLVFDDGLGSIVWTNVKSDSPLERWTVPSGDAVARLSCGSDALFIYLSLESGKVLRWDPLTSSTSQLWSFTDGPAEQIGVSSDNKCVGLASPNGQIVVVDAGTLDGRVIVDGRGIPCSAMQLDGRSELVAAGFLDGRVILCNLDSREVIQLRSTGSASVCSLAFNADSTRLVAGCRDGNVRFFDTATGEEILVIRDGTGALEIVKFNQDFSMLITASHDGTSLIRRIAPRNQQ